MSEREWLLRLEMLVRVLVAIGDTPVHGVVRDFVRDHARRELEALDEWKSTEDALAR